MMDAYRIGFAAKYEREDPKKHITREIFGVPVRLTTYDPDGTEGIQLVMKPDVVPRPVSVLMKKEMPR